MERKKIAIYLLEFKHTLGIFTESYIAIDILASASPTVPSSVSTLMASWKDSVLHRFHSSNFNSSNNSL